jgi:hypothetical protein
MAADGEEELVAQRVTDVRICHQLSGASSVVYLVRGVVDVFLARIFFDTEISKFSPETAFLATLR